VGPKKPHLIFIHMPITFSNISGTGNLALINTNNSGRFAASVSSSSSPLSSTLIYDLDGANFSSTPTSIGGSGLFGTNNTFQIPINSAFTYGTGDFTVEWWSYQTGTSGVQGIWRNSTNDSTFALGFWTVTQGSGNLVVTFGNGAGGNLTLSSNSTIASNTWHHYAVVRNGNLFKLYIDGTAQTSTFTSSISIPAQVGIMQVGNAGGQYQGYITNFRIVKGTAVYTSNFKPSNQQLTAISGTSLLLLMNSSASFATDSGPNNFTITKTGAVSYADFTPISTAMDATNTYPIAVNNNSSSISWSSSNGGIFTKSNRTATDYFGAGPNTTSQSYTVFMAYKPVPATGQGRILSSGAGQDWLLGTYAPAPGSGTMYMNVFYPGSEVWLSHDPADSNWHFIWGTYTLSTGVANLYIATSTQPAAVYKTATFTANGNRGFNQFYVWGRSGGGEAGMADIGFIKVYNGALTLSDIQSQHATYKARFGY